MKHYISALVENRAGVLARVSGLFARRGFNIDSLAVGETDDPHISRITIVVDGDDYIADQATKQIAKLHVVKKAMQLDPANMSSRELLLIKLSAEGEAGTQIEQIANQAGCEILDDSENTLLLEFDASSSEVDALIEQLSEFEILEIAKTGAIALEKGEGAIYDEDA